MRARVARELAELRAENARLLRLLKLTRTEANQPGPAQAGFFEAPPGPVHGDSAAEAKVAFFGTLFAARTDIYAVRWENARTSRAGWLPAVRGGCRKEIPHPERDYLPLAGELRERGHDPVVLRGGMGAKACTAGPARLGTGPGDPPLVAAATGPYIGEGFDCPALDTLFVAAPVGFKGSIVQWAGRILRASPARPPQKSTTITMCAHPSSRQPWPIPGESHLGPPPIAAEAVSKLRIIWIGELRHEKILTQNRRPAEIP